MSEDPYDILGIKRDAAQGEVQNAFRKLAKKLHPDLHPGDKSAEDRFKQISAAYQLLSDEEKRARFDRGEIDMAGAEQAPRDFYRQYASAGGPNDPYHSGAGFADFGEADDLFSRFFSQRSARGAFRSRGADRRFTMDIDFLLAVNGGKSHVRLPDGSSLEVTVPPGTHDGQMLRLRGKGEPGYGGGAPGDALIELHIRPHPFFIRDNGDIHIDLPISLSEAVLGGKVRVPTPSGAVQLTIPPNLSSGKRLRIKGKGVPKRSGGAGDIYVTLKIVLPEVADPDLTAFVKGWKAGQAQNPRRHLEGEQ
ncbi:DnaJ-class molecular chaperone [Sinorhizobium kostiense]|uniref:DnaJ-class molecular chaperone n=1 Tax=Sinorhizobium kostiense TaxID=76747 RepID=A0ABS4R143_9HYPH|nr:J domain-containing protein [Sinorhizobium kostiense]MBP2236611.1 DnaJ-class molecular chaperone [Sinorhizobium kostiense]